MNQVPEIYLGDGLYASWDGGSIKLRAPRDDGDHVVYLEPLTLENFKHWVQKLPEKVALSRPRKIAIGLIRERGEIERQLIEVDDWQDESHAIEEAICAWVLNVGDTIRIVEVQP